MIFREAEFIVRKEECSKCKVCERDWSYITGGMTDYHSSLLLQMVYIVTTTRCVTSNISDNCTAQSKQHGLSKLNYHYLCVFFVNGTALFNSQRAAACEPHDLWSLLSSCRQFTLHCILALLH